MLNWSNDSQPGLPLRFLPWYTPKALHTINPALWKDMVEFPAVTVSAVAQTANGFKVVHSWDFVYIFFFVSSVHYCSFVDWETHLQPHHIGLHFTGNFLDLAVRSRLIRASIRDKPRVSGFSSGVETRLKKVFMTLCVKCFMFFYIFTWSLMKMYMLSFGT